MALPRVPVATRSDPQSRPLIRFDARARLLDAARARMFGSSAVETGMLDLSIRVDGMALPDAAGIRREINRLLRNAAASIKDAVVQENRRIGYDTGLMASSWRERVVSESADTFRVELTNPTPYAAVARRAGADWRAGRTMLEYHIRPLVRRLAGRMARDLRATIAGMLARRRARATA